MKKLSIALMIIVVFLAGCISFQVGDTEKELVAKIAARHVGFEVQERYPDVAIEVLEVSNPARLPRKYRFEEDEVCITRVDDMVILYPRRKGWDLLARGIERFTGDFMADRDQPAEAEKRQGL